MDEEEFPLYNLSTYKSILSAIEEMERESDWYKELRFKVLFYSALLVCIGTIVYMIIQTKGIEYVLSADIITIALVPLFNYLFSSYEEDHIREQKLRIIQSYNDLIRINPKINYTNTINDEELKLKDIKGEILTLLKK